MRQIRNSVFETNSSSTHSITIVSEEDYEKFKKGELLLNWDDELVPVPEEEDEDLKTCDDFFDGDLETFVEKFTTKGGEKIVAFGRFGFDG